MIAQNETKPAILGGLPTFSKKVSIVSPNLPTLEDIGESLSASMQAGQLTNNGPYVQKLEENLQNRIGVRHADVVANGTLGLSLALEALGKRGKVILPSFTYSATAHSLYWTPKKMEPVFVDILPDTFTLDPAAVEAAISEDTVAIMPVHIYGHPCEIDELTLISQKHSLSLIFDSAHAFGSRYREKPIGQFGNCEVFSFHVTKVFPVGEGGCITTNDSELAWRLSLARKFGDPGNENTLFPGMNAKMQEFNAIVGLEMLRVIDQHIANRRRYATYMTERLKELPGINFQAVRPYAFTNYQNFAILVDEPEFGLSRDELFLALEAENINTRKYFFPPLHWHDSFKDFRLPSLPVTERISNTVLCLPFYSIMAEPILEGLCIAIEKIHTCSAAVRRQLI